MSDVGIGCGCQVVGAAAVVNSGGVLDLIGGLQELSRGRTLPVMLYYPMRVSVMFRYGLS